MNELFYVSFLLCMGKNIRSTRCLFMGKNIRSIRCLFMGKNIRSTRCLFMGKIIRSIDFLYVKGNRLFAHKLPIILPSTGTYYLTYNVTFRQLVSGCLGIYGIVEFNGHLFLKHWICPELLVYSNYYSNY